MILTKSLDKQDLSDIENWLEYWKNKNYLANSSLKNFKFKRAELILVTYLKDQLSFVSYLENLNVFMPKTFRILTRGVKTKYKLNTSGKYFEDNSSAFGLHAGLQAYWVKDNYKDHKVIMSTNADEHDGNKKSVQATRLITKFPHKKFCSFDGIKKIWYVNQCIWNIDINTCINHSIEFYDRYDLNFFKIYNNLKKFSI